MKIGIVFHKNPFGLPTGIDLVRLRAIAGGLLRRGIQVEVIAPVETKGMLDGAVPVQPVAALADKGRYDLVKTSYHFSIRLVDQYEGPVVSRIVRVVDDRLPERDDPFRGTLLECQEIIHRRAVALVLNNTVNEERWRMLYGKEPHAVLIPNGCPAEIPPARHNPFGTNEPVVLFLGSVAAPRMAEIINRAAELLRDTATIHLVGLNKCGLYGDESCVLSPLVVDHGEVVQYDVWDYIQHARLGLALATGPHAFDNDVSKMFDYLRGGLPVLSEEHILTNELVGQTGFGQIFSYGSVEDLVSKAKELLKNSPAERRERVMKFMATEHSWDRRVEAYEAFLKETLRS